MLVLYAQPSFSSFTSRFCSFKSSTLLSRRAISRLDKRPTALSINSSTGVTLASYGKLCPKFSRPRSSVFSRLPTSYTHKDFFFSQRHRKNSVQRSRKSRRTYTSTYSTAHKRRSFQSSFFKNKAPTLFSNPPTFFFQETCNFNSAASTRPTYDVACEGCPRRYQGPGVQKVCPTRMPSSAIDTRKRFRPRNGFSPQKQPES
jgi:hypothetical protein